MGIKRKFHHEYQSPIVTATYDPPFDADASRIAMCEVAERRARLHWERERNPLHVMEAFFRHIADVTAGKDEEKNFNVPVPRWMAQVVADGFEVFYSNLILEGNSRTSLDDCYGINKRHKSEFNGFVINADRVLNETYFLMWLFGLKRAPAIYLAYDILVSQYCESSKEGIAGMGNEVSNPYVFKVTPETVIQYADRGTAITYDNWLAEYENSGCTKEILQEDYLQLLDTLDTNLRGRLNQAQRAKRE